MGFKWLRVLVVLPAWVMPTLGIWPDAAFSERGPAPRAQRGAMQAEDPANARVIVKYRADASVMKRIAAVGAALTPTVLPQHAQALGQRTGLALRDGHVLGQRTQALQANGLSSSQLATRLAAEPDVEWAVPDQRRTAAAVVPNDPLYAGGQTSATPVVGQWYLRPPSGTVKSAIDAEGAWATTTGSASVTVAVVDSGVRYDHPDLAGKLWPGYDFIASTTYSNDGNGIDNDATDPGDWSSSTDSCGASDSSWHGTQVASLVAAATDNGIGMAAVGRNVMVLPVRVLGRCGGFDADIVAGMRWAAGLSTIPNPHPARVINISLGSSGRCDSPANIIYRDVMAELTAAGVTVVAAAGNTDPVYSGQEVVAPGNCDGVLAVSAVRHTGSKVGFSRIGPQVAIAAPGGNCVNTGAGEACLYPLIAARNTGSTTPLAHAYSDSFVFDFGTSFSAPLVAGTVGLMLTANPTLTPAQVKAALQATARPFPSSGASDTSVVACRAPDSAQQLECYCTTSTCGAGMLDAAAAVASVAAGRPQAQVVASGPLGTSVGATVSLSGAGSSAPAGRSISRYQWAISDGSAAARIESADNASSVTVRTLAAGGFTVQLTVTDSSNAVATAAVRLHAVGNPTALITLPSASVVPGSTLVLDGGSSVAGFAGRSIASYAWQVVDNGSQASVQGALDGPTLAVQTTTAGSLTATLTVTDSQGLVASTSRTVAVANPAPAPSGGGAGGGGGAVSPLAALGLLLAITALWREGPRRH